MTYPLYDFGGSGPILHIAVANGFPPQSYLPALQPLTTRYRVVCLPPRALWPDSDRVEKPVSWETMADDLLAGLQAHSLTGVVAIGHSFGAIASMLAVIKEPERFRALALLDPTILPDHALQMVEQMREKRIIHQMPLARGARRRRQDFPTIDEAYNYWRARKLFASWPEESLRHYTGGMLQPTAEGNGYRLTWPPEWEAHYYETIHTRPWAIVDQLRGLLPTLVVAGGTTDTFVEASSRRMRERLPDATYRTIPDHGHLFPQSAPDETRAVISGWLDSLESA